MGAVENLCSEGILMKAGEIEMMDATHEVVKRYLENRRTGGIAFSSLPSRGNKQIFFDSIEFLNDAGHPITLNEGKVQLRFLSTVEVRVGLKAKECTPGKVYVAITIKDLHGNKLTTLDNLYSDEPFYLNSNGSLNTSCYVDTMSMNPGIYSIDLWCSNGFDTFQKIENALELEVLERDVFGTGKVHHSRQHGFFFQKHKWKQIH
jgi:hypothetical protein